MLGDYRVLPGDETFLRWGANRDAFREEYGALLFADKLLANRRLLAGIGVVFVLVVVLIDLLA